MRFPFCASAFVLTAAVASAGSNLEVAAPLAPAYLMGGFGTSLDIDGDVLAVSTAVAGGSGTGTLAIYGRSSSGWAEIQSFSGTTFGASGDASVNRRTVAVDGDRIAYGIPVQGEVRVYVRVGGTYQLEETLFGSPTAKFGSALALQNDRLVVGAWRDSVSGSEAGAARVFVRSGGSWIQTQIVRPPPGSAGANSAWSVAIDGDTIALGERSGAVRVFDLVAGSFTESVLLPAPTSDCQDVALDGDTLVAGGIGAVGKARVWRRSGGTWSEETTLTGTFVGFGASVAVQGDELVVGEPFGPVSPAIRGRAHRYVRAGTAWTHAGMLESATDSAGDRHGFCVALDGVTAAVGSPSDDAGGIDRGSAQVYRLLGTLGVEVCSGAFPAPCPCSNATLDVFDEGCRNSTGRGAFLQLLGSASVAADDLVARVRHVRGGASALVFQGSAVAGGSGMPFRDGVLCVGGTIRRLRIGQANPDGVATIGPGLATPGAWAAGQTIHVQAWHRDGLGPCGQGSNLSQAVSVVLAP